MTISTDWGAYVKSNNTVVAAIVNAFNRRVTKEPKEDLIFGSYFEDRRFVGSGSTMYMFRDVTDVDYKNGSLYVAPGAAPHNLGEKLTSWSITLKPSIYVSADVEKEAGLEDHLGDTLMRRVKAVRETMLEAINGEMANVLTSGALFNSGTPSVTGGSGWYNSSDSGRTQLPPRYGDHDFPNDGHTVTFTDDNSATMTLTGHVETSSTSMSLNTDHWLSIVEHIKHHGYGKKGIEVLMNMGLAKEVILMGSISASGEVPDNVYARYWVNGRIEGDVLGATIKENEYIPSAIAVFVAKDTTPGVRLVQIPINAERHDNSEKRIIGVKFDYRGGYGINKRGAGYVAQFNI